MKQIVLCSLVLLSFSLLFSISVGAVYIPFKNIIQILLGQGQDTEKTILLYLRIPRVIEAFFVGSGLSVVGAFFQGLFRNPMAGPFVLGVSSGAAFGATLAIILGLGFWGLSFSAFLFALFTIYIVYLLARQGSNISMATMLLSGITISTFLHSCISLFMLFNHEELSTIVYWTMGSFSTVSWEKVAFSAPLITTGIVFMYFFSRELNAIMLGEETAMHLGVNTEKVKKIVLTTGTLISAIAVSITGIIGFIGLIVPHITRLLVGPDMRKLVPLSALIGGILLIITDTLSRTLLSPIEIPPGIITAIFGGPFFLYLLFNEKRKNERM